MKPNPNLIFNTRKAAELLWRSMTDASVSDGVRETLAEIIVQLEEISTQGIKK